jgi:hypothetical protein
MQRSARDCNEFTGPGSEPDGRLERILPKRPTTSARTTTARHEWTNHAEQRDLRPIVVRGNSVARRHGFDATVLAPGEDEEVTESADAICELSPLHAEAIEPLIQLVAVQLWPRHGEFGLDACGRPAAARP